MNTGCQRTKTMTTNESLLYENQYFRIEHARAFRLPGYLFVCAKDPAFSLTDLSPDALACLGYTLSIAVKALETIVNPLNVYCAKFGESGHPLHFHILPRTQWLTDRYLQDTQAPFVNGPLLLDWVDEKFLKGKAIVDQELEIHEVTIQLQQYFKNIQIKNGRSANEQSSPQTTRL